MSPKRKSGLHAGLSSIVERQTAPPPEKAALSKGLIEKFSEKAVPSHGIPPESIPALSIPSPSPPPVAAFVKPEHGYYPTFNDVSDSLIPEMKLDAYEQAVLWRMYRLSRGWWRDTCTVGHTKLSKSTNLSRSTVQKTVAKLIERGVIEFVGERGNDGTEYRVLPGVAVPQRGIPQGDIPSEFKERGPHGTRRSDGIPPGGHIKNKEDLKNRNKEILRLTPQEIEAKTALVVERLRAGEEIDEIAAEVAPTMHGVDWATVRSTALAQASVKLSKNRKGD